MNRKHIALAATLITAVLNGCSKDAERTELSSNPEVKVETLFKHDGCTVYRFYDSGWSHYFAKCGLDVEAISQRSCGKSCVKAENIKTYYQ